MQWEAVLRYLTASWLLLVVIGLATKFYRGRFLVGSFDEAFGMALHFFSVAAITMVLSPFLNPTLPRSLPVLVPPIALVGAAAGRWFYRALRDRGQPADEDARRAVLIYGAGDAGRQVLSLVRTDPTLHLRVVGFLDDNPGKRHLKIHGVPVLGAGSSLALVANEIDAAAVVLAVPAASGDLVDRVQRSSGAGRAGRLRATTAGRAERRAGQAVRHPPGRDRRRLGPPPDHYRPLVHRRLRVRQARADHRCRRIDWLRARASTPLVRALGALHAQWSDPRCSPSSSPSSVTSILRLARDCALRHPRQGRTPRGVLPAPARDRLPRRRAQAPADARAVSGRRVEDQRPRHPQRRGVAAAVDVHHFVNISTDKAADPANVLGSTKRLAERFTAWRSEVRACRTCRFGSATCSVRAVRSSTRSPRRSLRAVP